MRVTRVSADSSTSGRIAKKKMLKFFFLSRGAKKKNTQMDLLPDWVKDGASPVRRLLMKIYNGESIVPAEIQTVRIIVCIQAILKRETLRCHPKMRAVDVAELMQLQKDVAWLMRKSAPANTSAVDSSQPMIVADGRMKRRFLCALNALSRVSLQYMGAPYSAGIVEGCGIYGV